MGGRQKRDPIHPMKREVKEDREKERAEMGEEVMAVGLWSEWMASLGCEATAKWAGISIGKEWPSWG